MQLASGQKLGKKALYSPTTTFGCWKNQDLQSHLGSKQSAEDKSVRGCVPLTLEHPEDDQISLL